VETVGIKAEGEIQCREEDFEVQGTLLKRLGSHWIVGQAESQWGSASRI